MIEVRTGSDSDIKKMGECYKFLEELKIPYTPRILSAHRTPQAMTIGAQNLSKEGFRVSISAAGGSAHLPGMTASETLVPVVGLPIIGSTLSGLDSFLSIVQMPEGIPVGTVGSGMDRAAAELATRIAYLDNLEVRNKLRSNLGLVPRSSITSFSGISLIAGEDVSHECVDVVLRFAESIGVEVKQEIDGSTGVLIVCDRLDKDNKLAETHSTTTEIPVVSLYFPDSRRSVENGALHWMGLRRSKAPVALMGLNRYKNAVLYAAQIQALYNERTRTVLEEYRQRMKQEVVDKNSRLTEKGIL